MCTVPMLLYHKVAEPQAASRRPELHVSPRRFAAQLAMLRALGCRGVTVGDYLAYRRGERALPPRAVVITFDDGYRSNRTIAAPLLTDYGFPATICVTSRLLGATNVWDPDEPQEPLLDAAELRELQRAGIEFQSHTCTHARLTAVPRAVARAELADSRIELEQLLGAPVEAVAYPWGAHDDTVLRLTEDAGYAAGLVVRRRLNRDSTSLLALRRIDVSSHTSRRRLAWDLFRLRWRGN